MANRPIRIRERVEQRSTQTLDLDGGGFLRLARRRPRRRGRVKAQGLHPSARNERRSRLSFLLARLCRRRVDFAVRRHLLPLKQHARELGLAFASAIFVHLGFVLRLCAVGPVPSTETIVIFGTAAAFTFLLALLSISRLRKMLPRAFWRAIRFVAMNYIALAILDFARLPLEDLRQSLAYLPFLALAILGPALRLGAWAQTTRPGAKEICPSFEPLALTGSKSFTYRARTAEARLSASAKWRAAARRPPIRADIAANGDEIGYGKVTPPSANDMAK